MLITRGVAKKLHGESQLHEIHATDFSYCKATHVGCKRTYCAADYQREKSVTSAERKRIMLYCGYLESLSSFSKIVYLCIHICVFVFVYICICIVFMSVKVQRAVCSISGKLPLVIQACTGQWTLGNR